MVECQREDWPAHTKQSKLNRKFELREQKEAVRAREKQNGGRERPLGTNIRPRDITCVSNAVDTTPFATSLGSWQYLFGLRMNFSFYFDRIFAGIEAGYEHYRLLFEQLGDLGFEMGKGVTSITVSILLV